MLISFWGCAAEQVSLKEVEHFKLEYLGNISVSATNESVTSPSDLQKKLSELADNKGGGIIILLPPASMVPILMRLLKCLNNKCCEL